MAWNMLKLKKYCKGNICKYNNMGKEKSLIQVNYETYWKLANLKGFLETSYDLNHK